MQQENIVCANNSDTVFFNKHSNILLNVWHTNLSPNCFLLRYLQCHGTNGQTMQTVPMKKKRKADIFKNVTVHI